MPKVKSTSNNYFKIVAKESGIAVKEFLTLAGAYTHVRKYINDSRSFDIQEWAGKKSIASISAYYFTENFKNESEIPESIFELQKI